MKEDIYRMLLFFFKSALIYIVISSPIMIYLIFTVSYIKMGFLGYLGLISSMIIVNIFFGMLLFKFIASFISRKKYKSMIERLVYLGLFPSYLIFILSILVVYFTADDIDKAITWLFVFWGYCFGAIFIFIRFVIKKIQSYLEYRMLSKDI